MLIRSLFLLAVCGVLSSCGGGASSSNTPAPAEDLTAVQSLSLLPNEMQITIAQWKVNGSVSSRIPNQPHVSIQICNPLNNSCQTIDNVLVDTGSYGLRLLKSAVTIALTQSTINGNPLAECTQFVSGYMWGGIYAADISLGNQKAMAVPIQLVDGAYAQIPASCASSGVAIHTTTALGANGILGVGSFQEDCGSRCVDPNQNPNPPNRYFTCNTLNCTATYVPLANQVVNPVAKLAANNNGVVIDLPSVNTDGQVNTVGRLIFGIGTSTNNQLNGETSFPLDAYGYLRTTYNGTAYAISYIDSGSNGYFFNDAGLTRCTVSTSFYCPNPTITKTATIGSNTTSVSKTVTFNVGSSDTKPSNRYVLPDLAGPGSGFAWGLPFFYGRKVFVSISGKTANGTTTPFIAFKD